MKRQVFCEKCGTEMTWDREPDPMWPTGIYELECPQCGYTTNINIGGIDTAYMSRFTTSTKEGP